MPIKPENKKRYPANWKAIRADILKRAENKCEFCGVENYSIRDNGSRVVLTVAHLDHTPENCNPENLRALCQKCHNRYDAKHRAETRKARKEVEKAFAKECDKLRKAGEELARTLCEGICKVLNGIPVEKHEEEKPQNDKCDGCIFRGEYQDMGATTPICKKGVNLAEAVKMRNDTTPCKLKCSWQEISEYVKKREADNGSNTSK